VLLEGVGAAKVSFTFFTHLFRLLPIELSLLFCVGTSVISYIILPSCNCNILSLKCGLTKNIIFEHFVGSSGLCLQCFDTVGWVAGRASGL